MTVSDDQLLHGSYGGAGGLPAGVTELLRYGFSNIDVCEQSPVIIQFQSATPIRQAPIGKPNFINSALYNRGLGHGKAMGVFTLTRDTNNPGQLHLATRNAFTFPAMSLF